MKAIKIWKDTFKALGEHPELLIPFVVAGLMHALAAYIVFLAPQKPVAYILAPVVKAFFGEKFLHYPLNLYLLPKLFYYAQLAVTATFGVLMAGLVIGMLRDRNAGICPRVFFNLLVSFKRYFALLGIWLVIFFFSFLLARFSRTLTFSPSIMKLIPYVMYMMSIFIYFIFVYVTPALLIETRNIFSALKRGLSFLTKFFIPSLFLVLVPTLFYLPVIILRQKLPALMGSLFPEMVFFVIAASIIVTLFINVMITVSTTLVFLNEKDGKK